MKVFTQQKFLFFPRCGDIEYSWPKYLSTVVQLHVLSVTKAK